MKKHLDMILISSGMIIFLLTFSEIIDIQMGDFYGSLYYWLIWLSGVLFIFGLGNVVKKLNKKIESKSNDD
tara:strand:- start:700 stop:912 length:213 start_codon:yes stop_codon:yes gene_type:complete